MATNKQSKSTCRAEVKDLFGIDRAGVFGTRGCGDIKNFRLDSSGALVKRSGRKKLAELVYSVHSAIPFSTSRAAGEADVLVLAPPALYAQNTESGKLYEIADDLGEAGSRASVCLFGGRAYVAGGGSLRVYDKEADALTPVRPYAPLYGRGWHPRERGEIYESRNLLSPRLRINYRVEEATDSLYLGFEAASLSRVEVNGAPWSDYSLENYYVMGNFPEGCEVTLWLTRSETTVFDCDSLTCVSCDGEERLAAYGFSDESLVALSAMPDADALNASSRGFFDGGALYFPESLAYFSGGEEITAVAPCSDGFCVFTKGSCRFVLPKNGGTEVFTLSREIGCICPHAALSRGREVYVISKGGIFRFTLSPASPEESRVERLSDCLIGREPIIFDDNCAVLDNQTENELWFSCNGTVFIYNPEFGCFYSYPAMPVVAIVNSGAGLFVYERFSLWAFSDTLYADVNGTKKEAILASVSSHWLDLGDGAQKKRKLEVYPTFKMTADEYFILKVETDGGLHESFTVRGNDNAAPDTVKVRVHRSRFRRAAFTVTSYDESRPRLFSVVLTAEGTN